MVAVTVQSWVVTPSSAVMVYTTGEAKSLVVVPLTCGVPDTEAVAPADKVKVANKLDRSVPVEKFRATV